MDFQVWAAETGEIPRVDLTGWFRDHPEIAKECGAGFKAGFDKEQVARYAVAQGCPSSDGEKIRAALRRVGVLR